MKLEESSTNSRPQHWAIFEMYVDEYEFSKVVDFFRCRRPRFTIRICGDREELLRSGLRKGSLGYFYVHDPYNQYDLPDNNFYGRFLEDGNRPLLLEVEEVWDSSFRLDEVWRISLVDQPVIIVSGDFRRLKGVVTAEYYTNPKRPEVDVLIKTMTLTRIINVPKRIVRPLNYLGDRGSSDGDE